MPQMSLSHSSILFESISLGPKGVVWSNKSSMAIEITYLLPNVKTKIVCILVTYGTSQISMNSPSRENTIGQEFMD
jgi:hypothetical protein